jgi:hypothetical protein
MTLDEAQKLMNLYYDLAEYWKKEAQKIRNAKSNKSNTPKIR